MEQMRALAGYGLIFLTIALTVYAQLVLKWQVGEAGPFPADWQAVLGHIIGILLRPWVWTCFIAVFLTSVLWMAVLSRYHLSFAYPFLSLSYPTVIVASAILFNEPLSLANIASIALIMAGISLLAVG